VLGHLQIILWAITLGFSVPLTALAFYTCYWTTYAWHSPEKHVRTRVIRPRNPNSHSFSVIIPVRNESYEVVSATTLAVLGQSLPQLQVVLSVGFDDPLTLAVARRLLAENPGSRLRLSISRSPVHTKPTQLNAALRDCDGEIVGVLDAETVSAPGLLAQVDALFADPQISVVQGGVIMTNYRSSFVALRSALEYFTHHRSKMHFTAAHGSILMGGNTVFFRREVLNVLGGWDETNLAEDAELSLRLQTAGYRITVAYDPQLVSREEAPATIRAWTKQRTRWNLGFLQTLAKGQWRQLPRAAERRLAVWNLIQPTLVSVSAIALPFAVLTILTKPPLWLAMLTWSPAAPTLLLISLECTLLRTFGREHGFRIRVLDYVKLVLSAPVYTLLQAFAAVRASVKYLRGDYRWEKTTHEGLHLVSLPSRELGAPAREVGLTTREVAGALDGVTAREAVSLKIVS
jgi:cellulose synthase/poly-beta-1,6-N-acetylglucosamine synthase-like glycosyltransferase